MFSFLPLINNSVPMVLIFFVSNHIDNLIIKYDQYFSFFIDVVLFNIFYKHHSYHPNIQKKL